MKKLILMASVLIVSTAMFAQTGTPTAAKPASSQTAAKPASTQTVTKPTATASDVIIEAPKANANHSSTSHQTTKKKSDEHKDVKLTTSTPASKPAPTAKSAAKPVGEQK